MSPRERMAAALQRDVPDRVPVFLRDLTLGLDVAGYSTPEVCAGGFDAERSARAVVATQRTLGHDAVVGGIQFCGMEVEAMGGEMRFPPQGIPSIVRHPLDSPEKVDAAEPPDPRRDAPLSNLVRSYRLVSERIGGRVAVVGNVEGPITKAGILRGLDVLSLDLVSNPDLFERTVGLSTRLATDLSAALAPHCHAMFVAAATDNPGLFGSEAFLRHTVPNLEVVVRAMRDAGLPTVFHPHGVFSHGDLAGLVDASLGTGIAGFQFAEENDLGEAKRRWGGRTCILGGVNAFTTLLLGPADAVRAETRSCLDACAEGGGFVLMCSCSLHRGMPLDHVRAMVEECAAHGAYGKRTARGGGGGGLGGRRRQARCPGCGERYDVLMARGRACLGCPSAVRSCPHTRCPRCDTEAPLEGDAARLSSLLAAYRRQFGLAAFR